MSRPSERVRGERVGPGPAALAVLIGGLLAVAGVGLWVSPSPGASAPAIKADGPTFFQALAGLNASVSQQSGGPWALFAVWGIASPVAFSPSSLGWVQNNLTVNSCQSSFRGVTLWNGSIPLFNGSYQSGTAPFWQFAFFSNASQSILIGTNVQGVSKLYPPIGMSSPCAAHSDLGYEPWVWAATFVPFPPDTPVLAMNSWNAIGQRWMSSNLHAYEAFILGWSYWGSANPEGLVVKYARCGQVGFTGVQPVADVVLKSDGTYANYLNGTQGCGDVISLGPPPVYGAYALDFSPASTSSAGGTTWISTAFQSTYGNRSLDSDAGGLVSWMLRLTLKDASGQLLQVAPPMCAAWVPSPSDCTSGASGWYGLLLNEAGGWQNSFPSLANLTSWSVPGVALVSNQLIVLVVPTSWNTTGDVLNVVGNVAAVGVSGNITL